MFIHILKQNFNIFKAYQKIAIQKNVQTFLGLLFNSIFDDIISTSSWFAKNIILIFLKSQTSYETE